MVQETESQVKNGSIGRRGTEAQLSHKGKDNVGDNEPPLFDNKGAVGTADQMDWPKSKGCAIGGG